MVTSSKYRQRRPNEYVVYLHNGKDGDDAKWETIFTTTSYLRAEKKARYAAQQHKGQQVLLECFDWEGYRRREPETFVVFPATATA